MRHKIIINVINEKGQKTNVIKGAVGKIPNRLIKFLFEDYRQIYLLDPGMTVAYMLICKCTKITK